MTRRKSIDARQEEVSARREMWIVKSKRLSCTRFLNPFWRVRTQQNWIVISFRMLVTKTDGAFCCEREAMLRLRSINLAASGSTRSSTGRGRKSSKLLRKGYNLRLILFYLDGWRSGLHVTNYLCRNPSINSLTIVVTISIFLFSSVYFFTQLECAIFYDVKMKKYSQRR